LIVEAEGAVETLDDADTDWPGQRSRLAVSVAGSHLKGYVDGQTRVHGHRPDPERTGRVGLLLKGTGLVRILDVESEQVEDEH
jgi:hypothetical protein